ncbi:hypothetical protein ACIQUQ_32980 [Streptomyces sp. NPDC101118]|uniref:hypothetical protein n=1 Tax=Streptomyces sp. NPDC101118 TaxID=3366109 RepID=UPI00381BCFC2
MKTATTVPTTASTLVRLRDTPDPCDADQRAVNPAAAALAALSPALNPRAVYVLGQIEAVKQDAEPPVCVVFDRIGSLIRETGDADAVLDFALAAVARPANSAAEAVIDTTEGKRPGAERSVAYWETAELDAGILVVFKRYGDHTRVAYDPAQVSRVEAEGLIRAYCPTASR